MSKKLQKAANEKVQKSILKYAKVTEEECRIEGEGHHDKADTTALESAESGTELKDATSTPKRKRSQVSPSHNSGLQQTVKTHQYEQNTRRKQTRCNTNSLTALLWKMTKTMNLL